MLFYIPVSRFPCVPIPLLLYIQIRTIRSTPNTTRNWRGLTNRLCGYLWVFTSFDAINCMIKLILFVHRGFSTQVFQRFRLLIFRGRVGVDSQLWARTTLEIRFDLFSVQTIHHYNSAKVYPPNPAIMVWSSSPSKLQ